MSSINITHQIERTKHRFSVGDPENLTQAEVDTICRKMQVEALFINGRLYRINKPLKR